MKRICFFFLLVLANFYSFAQVDSFRPVYDEEKQDFYNRISRYKELSDAKIYFTSDIYSKMTKENKNGKFHYSSRKIERVDGNIQIIPPKIELEFDGPQYVYDILYDVFVGICDGSGLKGSKLYLSELAYQPSSATYGLYLIPKRRRVAKKMDFCGGDWPIRVYFEINGNSVHLKRIRIDSIDNVFHLNILDSMYLFNVTNCSY